MSEHTIIIVDDDPSVRKLLALHCASMGYAVRELDSGEALFRALEAPQSIACILLDIGLPGIDGFEVLGRLRQSRLDLPVIVSTALDDSETILRALRLGASDFLAKPLDRARLEASIANAVRTHVLAGEVSRLNSSLAIQAGISGVIYRSEAIRTVLHMIDRVKDSHATVLLLGESGVGKEVFARALHHRSRRAAEPFVAVNCGAIPQALIESELFGHEAGAFTGAEARRIGTFELAGGGTLLLDEIGEMPMESQVRLLRVLQERKIVRVGGHEEIPVAARVVCATNQDLGSAIKAGRFREDLYYRIGTFPIVIPPLRDRREDIPALAEAFLARCAKVEGRAVRGFTSDAMEALERWSWPGNVRELEHTIERAVLLSEGEDITLDMLPDQMRGTHRIDGEQLRTLAATEALVEVEQKTMPGATGHDGAQSSPTRMLGRLVFRSPTEVVPLERVERACIVAALDACGGDVQMAAERLGLSRSTMYRRLQYYGISPRRD